MKVVENATNLKNIDNAVHDIKSSLKALHVRIDTFPDIFISKEEHTEVMKSHNKDHLSMSKRITALEEVEKEATRFIIKSILKYGIMAIVIIGSGMYALAKFWGLV